jgi:hypothetical protein
MSEKSNRCHLELVLLFDPRDESNSICSHNFSTEDARPKLNELREEGLFAFSVGQPSHRALDRPDDRTACSAELARVLAENE